MFRRFLNPALGLVVAFGAVYLGTKFSEEYHPHLQFQVTEDVSTEFILKPKHDLKSCEATIASLTNTFISSCPTCAVTNTQCLTELDDAQRGLVSAKMFDTPTAFFVEGVIKYESTNPASALATCRTAEAHTNAHRPGSMKCFGPDEVRVTDFHEAGQTTGNSYRSAAGLVAVVIIAWLFYLSLEVSFLPKQRTKERRSSILFERISAYIDLSSIPRHTKRLIMVFADVILLPLSVIVASIIHFHGNPINIISASWLTVIAPFIAIPYFRRLGLYRAILRHMGSTAVLLALVGVAATTVTLYVIDLLVFRSGTHWSFFIIFWGVTLIFTGGSRLAARFYFYSMQSASRTGDKVLIYGAGDAGIQLLASLAVDDSYLPIAFIDDNANLHNTVIRGLRVYPPGEIPHLTETLGAKQVFLAMPTLSIGQRKSIVDKLEKYAIHVSTVPSITEIVSGRAKLDEIREIEIDDLLGRDPVLPSSDLLSKCITGKTVMVTGAGGSIGSELCRQIVNLQPSRLILFELSEFALYSIEHELNQQILNRQLNIQLNAIIGNVRADNKLYEVYTRFGVQTVFHAAAYKHVPLVEANVAEGVLNNTLGTLSAALAAERANVETFLLISTDKAVRPTNAMGASKRAAELVLQALNERPERRDTVFCMVRFGNVLGSSGSVVPLFRKQIKAGGPITVTHPNITRFFMSIPEAAQLVIQAAAMARGGEVFLLDMGEPVKILDLARKMIHLHGFSVADLDDPDGDIAITFTGLRPGEKLYEELLIGEDPKGTEHPRIMKGHEDFMDWRKLEPILSELSEACSRDDADHAKTILASIVSGYQAKPGPSSAEVIKLRDKSEAS